MTYINLKKNITGKIKSRIIEIIKNNGNAPFVSTRLRFTKNLRNKKEININKSDNNEIPKAFIPFPTLSQKSLISFVINNELKNSEA